MATMKCPACGEQFGALAVWKNADGTRTCPRCQGRVKEHDFALELAKVAAEYGRVVVNIELERTNLRDYTDQCAHMVNLAVASDCLAYIPEMLRACGPDKLREFLETVLRTKAKVEGIMRATGSQVAEKTT